MAQHGHAELMDRRRVIERTVQLVSASDDSKSSGHSVRWPPAKLVSPLLPISCSSTAAHYGWPHHLTNWGGQYPDKKNLWSVWPPQQSIQVWSQYHTGQVQPEWSQCVSPEQVWCSLQEISIKKDDWRGGSSQGGAGELWALFWWVNACEFIINDILTVPSLAYQPIFFQGMGWEGGMREKYGLDQLDRYPCSYGMSIWDDVMDRKVVCWDAVISGGSRIS